MPEACWNKLYDWKPTVLPQIPDNLPKPRPNT